MLTKGDGNKLDYLQDNKDNKYKNYNNDLFMDLKNIISENKRNLTYVEKIQALTKCKFIDDALTKRNRELYFENVYKNAQEVDIVFFDPYNGITPNTNKKKEIKYVYWDELQKIWSMKKNILVYQSYRHEKEFVKKMIDECKKNLSDSTVLCFKKRSQIMFLYITKSEEINSDKINEEWGNLEK
jgi:16S rRNA G966 N2-methylase RsmD